MTEIPQETLNGRPEVDQVLEQTLKDLDIPPRPLIIDRIKLLDPGEDQIRPEQTGELRGAEEETQRERRRRALRRQADREVSEEHAADSNRPALAAEGLAS